jgi:hypothetical protein
MPFVNIEANRLTICRSDLAVHAPPNKKSRVPNCGRPHRDGATTITAASQKQKSP